MKKLLIMLFLLSCGNLYADEGRNGLGYEDLYLVADMKVPDVPKMKVPDVSDMKVPDMNHHFMIDPVVHLATLME